MKSRNIIIFGVGALIVCALILAAIGWQSKLNSEVNAPLDLPSNQANLTKNTSDATTRQLKSSQPDQPNQAGVQVKAATPSSVGLTTYRPGAQRLRTEVSKAIIKKESPWWLYAFNEADAAWLDSYGYPTIAEHYQLKAMSETELSKLSQAGDVNALAHLVSKKAIAAYEAKVADKAFSADEVNALAASDSPYVRSVGIELYGELIRRYSEPIGKAKDEQQKRILDDAYRRYVSLATISTALGDTTTSSLVEQVELPEWKTGFPEISMKKESPLGTGQSIVMVSRFRMERGLAPLVVNPRPTPGGRPYYDFKNLPPTLIERK